MKIFYGRLALPRFSERVELDAAMGEKEEKREDINQRTRKYIYEMSFRVGAIKLPPYQGDMRAGNVNDRLPVTMIFIKKMTLHATLQKKEKQ